MFQLPTFESAFGRPWLWEQEFGQHRLWELFWMPHDWAVSCPFVQAEETASWCNAFDCWLIAFQELLTSQSVKVEISLIWKPVSASKPPILSITCTSPFYSRNDKLPMNINLKPSAIVNELFCGQWRKFKWTVGCSLSTVRLNFMLKRQLRDGQLYSFLRLTPDGQCGFASNDME